MNRQPVNWNQLMSAHLQGKGYFVRYCQVEGVAPWIEVCKPNEDVTAEEIVLAATLVTSVAFEIVQIRGGHDRCWNEYVRMEAKP